MENQGIVITTNQARAGTYWWNGLQPNAMTENQFMWLSDSAFDLLVDWKLWLDIPLYCKKWKIK